VLRYYICKQVYFRESQTPEEREHFDKNQSGIALGIRQNYMLRIAELKELLHQINYLKKYRY
jgi:hypothetical protein